MRNIQLKYNVHHLTGLLAMALLVFSCSKTPVTETQKEQTPVEDNNKLNISVTLTPGVRTVEKPIYLPSGTISVKSANKAANYIIEFRVDDGETFTLKGIWDGRARTLDTYLQSCQEYGEHIVEGRVYNIADASDAVDFSESVWMKYESAEITRARWVVIGASSTPEEQPEFNDKHNFHTRETGRLIITYEPKTSKLFIEAEDSQGLFSFSEMSNSGGTCVLRYSADKTGKTTLRIVAVNGDESEEMVSSVVVEGKNDNESSEENQTE